MIEVFSDFFNVVSQAKNFYDLVVATLNLIKYFNVYLHSFVVLLIILYGIRLWKRVYASS